MHLLWSGMPLLLNNSAIETYRSGPDRQERSIDAAYPTVAKDPPIHSIPAIFIQSFTRAPELGMLPVSLREQTDSARDSPKDRDFSPALEKDVDGLQALVMGTRRHRSFCEQSNTGHIPKGHTSDQRRVEYPFPSEGSTEARRKRSRGTIETEREWLASLHDRNGADGEEDGV